MSGAKRAMIWVGFIAGVIQRDKFMDYVKYHRMQTVE